MVLKRKELRIGSYIVVFLFTIFIYFVFAYISLTPRAKVNVIQIITVIFFLVVLFQRQKATTIERTEMDCDLKVWLILPFVLMIGFLLYVPTLPSYFISDDFLRVYENWHSPFDAFWTAFAKDHGGAFFRPLGAASFALDKVVWGKWPFGYHLTNVILHLLSVLGIFFFCKKLQLGVKNSLTAAFFFMILPVETEAIVWISSRFDLLATVLMVWSALLYVQYRIRQKTNLYLIIGLVLEGLALCSKESAYILPLLLILVELVFLRPHKWRPLLYYFAVAMFMFLYRWNLLGGIGGYIDSTGQSTALTFKLTTIQGLFLRAPALMLFGLNWRQPPFVIPMVVAAVLSGILLLILFNRNAEGNDTKYLIFCFSWIFLTLLPGHFLLLIDSGLTNSRVLYTASIGIAILLSLTISRIYPTRLKLWVIVILFLSFSIGVLHNQSAWRYSAELGYRTLNSLKKLEPSPPPCTAISIQDMPDTLNGVFFFQQGLPQAIELLYGRSDVIGYKEGAVEKSLDLSTYSTIRVRFTKNTSKPLERIDK